MLGHSPRHQTDRPGRQGSQAASTSKKAATSPANFTSACCSTAILASDDHGIDRRRHGNRGSRQATPEKIIKVAIDPAPASCLPCPQLAFGLGLEGAQVKSASRFIMALYKAFNDLDCSMVEINPLVVTGAGDVIALDAKVNFDDNALYRHPDVEEMRDETKKIPPNSKRPSTSSTTSSSTVTSAAWSTVPVWPWRPWTSSSCMAATCQLPWTSVAAHQRTRYRSLQDHSW